ncbi:uncharacterized protein LOC133898526, partial [Phragmites australis]|uniref:uncharacterized protein LOC133898526 n=1 Tax=Phragmites australis TaxID=29695 RepID=UPI002D776D71
LEGAPACSSIPYHKGALEYSLPVFCDCARKAARWISWSDDNPGRRYVKCMMARNGGCSFWKWYEDATTTPFVKQVLVDLCDMVWSLRKEKEEHELIATISEGRSKFEEMGRVHGAELCGVREQLEAKDALIVELSVRTKKLENKRKWFGYVVAGCVVVLGFVMFWWM